jgi:serine-type D-Ala-D-Ala carboxypeptidase/endopeptidase
LTADLKSRWATGNAFPQWPYPDPYTPPSLLAGAGALRSTANDLLRFLSANLGLTPSPLTPLMMATQAVHHSDSGRSGRLLWAEDSGIIYHGGLVYGYQSIFGMDPARRRGAVILTNCCTSEMPTLYCLSGLLNERSPRPPRSASMDYPSLDKYVGQYDLGNGYMIAIRRQGQRFILQTWTVKPLYPMPLPASEIFPQSQTVFYNQMWNFRVTFVRDARRQATQLIVNSLSEGNGEAIATRISPTLPPPVLNPIDTSIYEDYVGQYRAAILGLIPVGPTLNIYRTHDGSGDHLFAYVQDLPDLGAGELFPHSEDTFFSLLPDSSISFKRYPAGKVGVLIYLNGRNIDGVRVSKYPIEPQKTEAQPPPSYHAITTYN